MTIKAIIITAALALPFCANAQKAKKAAKAVEANQVTSLKEAYRDYWRTSVSVNQWEVKADPNYKNERDYTGFVSADQVLCL